MTTEPIKTKPLNGGIQKLYRFDNGYGASVVQGPYTYGGPSGLWELAVIEWHGNSYDLTYETPITDDVIGHLSESAVVELLEQIAALPADSQTPTILKDA